MKLKITLILLLQAFCFQQIYAQCSGADFEEQNGIAILELDSKVSGSWKKESTSGSSGGSALTYRGSNYFNSPGNSTINYQVRINSSGTYRFIWRNKISVIASHNASTEHNDSWLKINASNFYGQSGSSRIYPGGSGKNPTPEGASSGGWFKVYTNTIDWSYSTKTSDNDAHAVYATFNSAGVYTIQVSARSNGHTIDRMVLYKEGSYSAAQAESLSRSETTCSGGTTTPTPTPSTNEAPTVSITSPSNGQNINEGSSVTVQLSSNDADGNISDHEIYVNNVLVDTDGINYSPYTISNIQSGSYTIRAVVTDSNGESNSSTVNITVDDDTDTTPDPDPTPDPTPPASNSAPSVSFTNLTNGQSFTAGSNVSVNLNSSDSDGSVVSHQIFVNDALVDTDGTSYTSHVIEGITAGSYSIKATVTDNSGETTSNTVSITVSDDDDEPVTNPTPPSSDEDPSVSFTNLTNGQSFTAGSDVSVNLNATDSDGSVIKYEIFVNGSLVDTDGSNYTPYILSSASAGNYEISATVTDDDNNTNTANVNIVVGSGGTTPTPPTNGNQAPTVQITSLSEGQVVPLGEEVLVGVIANDSDGSVVKYQVYIDGNLVDTDGEVYTSHPFQESTSGNYQVQVVVTDNDGATGSDIVNISVGSGSTPTTPTTPTPSLTLNLINAITNNNIGTLTNGATLSFSNAQNINIKANVPSGAKSVLLVLSGAQTETRYENAAPYALFGDVAGNYNAENLSNGSYTLKVSAYSSTNGSGTLLATETVNFNVGSITNKTAYAFPNPVQTDGKVSVHLPKGNGGDYEYTVSNAMGIQLEKGTFKVGESETDVDLELSNIGRQTKGVYYLSISKSGSNQIIPLLRQ